MSKVNVKANINGDLYNGNGIKRKNNIIYINNAITVNFEINSIVKLIEESALFKLELIFDKDKKTTGKYLLKEYNQTVAFLIETKDLRNDSNILEIIYKLEDEENVKTIKLEFEEI